MSSPLCISRCLVGGPLSQISFVQCGLLKVVSSQIVPDRSIGRSTKRRRTHPFRWWTKRRADSFKPQLTESNQEFLTDYMSVKFSSPLIIPDLDEYKNKSFAPDSKRVGLIARKLGTHPLWYKTGKRVLTTLLQVNDNHVIKCYSSEKFKDQVIFQDRWRYEGMACAIIGAEGAPIMKYSSAYAGLFNEAGTLPKRKITKMVISDDAILPPGTPLYAAHFRPGNFVDCFGRTIDHGFQGVMTRWDAAGQPKGRTTKADRRIGSIGRGRRTQGPLKGKKMPGHMGQERRTINGLEIMRINTKLNIIYVKGGSVPGENGNWVYIFDSKIFEKTPTIQKPPPFPTYFPEEEEELPENLYHPDIHQFSDPTIIFQETEEEKKKQRQGAKLAKIRLKK
ncbi:mitochondrial ribosomal protein L3 [Brevipalpus obovatus]|uniref:mitochondrial ribosomal protein L3 n=1 Tax=Brevipalpus obovatus TaxID=246614 RepID=UPI003D9F7551